MPTQARAVETRDAVIRAAAEVFVEKGYTAAVSTEIAAVMGRSKGLLSYHFPTKAELAFAVVERQYSLWEEVAQEVQDNGHVGVDAMIILSLKVAESFRDNVVVRAAARLQLEAVNIAIPLPRPYEAWIERTTKLAEAAMQTGELVTELSAERVSQFLVSAFSGIQQISQTQDNRHQITNRVRDMWLVVLPGLGVADPVSVMAASFREAE